MSRAAVDAGGRKLRVSLLKKATVAAAVVAVAGAALDALKRRQWSP